MTLINSIAGIRGTIGGGVEDNLTPIDIIEFTSSFCSYVKSDSISDDFNIVIGRDSRKSGKYILNNTSPRGGEAGRPRAARARVPPAA